MEIVIGLLIGVCMALIYDKFRTTRADQETEQERLDRLKTEENLTKMMNYNINQAYNRRQ